MPWRLLTACSGRFRFTTLVHANYKRFIELLFTRGGGAFKDKYAAVLTTSIHFFDHTALDYTNGICDDLGMKFVGSYSAAMDDLLKKEERNRLLLFANGFLHAIESFVVVPRRFPPVVHNSPAYAPGPPSKTVDTLARTSS